MSVPRLAYSPEEAAEALSVSRAHIYNLITRGELRAVKFGRSTRIPATEMDRLLAGERSAETWLRPMLDASAATITELLAGGGTYYACANCAQWTRDPVDIAMGRCDNIGAEMMVAKEATSGAFLATSADHVCGQWTKAGSVSPAKGDGF